MSAADEGERPHPAAAGRGALQAALAARAAERDRMRLRRAERLAVIRARLGPAPGAGEDDAAALESFLAALVGAAEGDDPARPGRGAGGPAPLVPLAPPERGSPGGLGGPASAPPRARADGGAPRPAGREDWPRPAVRGDDAPRPAVRGDDAPRRAPPEKDAGGLARLPGAGPGLVAALIRGGVPDLAALAALDAAGLAARLGPVARLIDLEAWIAAARAQTALR